MDDHLPRRLLAIFRAAVIMKLVGIGVMLLAGRYFLGESLLYRWSMSIVTALILLLTLLPLRGWPGGATTNKRRHFQLLLAISAGILAPFIDLIYAAWIPYENLTANKAFNQLFGWSYIEVNHVHALGILFVIVPVLIACWQYGHRGRELGGYLTGLAYFATAWLIPEDGMVWGIYWAEGFVILGVMHILAFVTVILASAEQEKRLKLMVIHEELAAAHAKLAAYAATAEKLAVSEERNRLARELHDTLAHALSGTSIQLQAVQTLLENEPQSAADALTNAQQQIRNGLQESRRAIAALRAAPLEELGLSEAVSRRAQQAAAWLDVPLDLQIETVPALPEILQHTFYRVAEEALINVEKYAQPTQLRVSLTADDAGVAMSVIDNGIGFMVNNIRQDKQNGQHLGICGMKERAAMAQAQFSLVTAPGEGTAVRLFVAQDTLSLLSSKGV